VKCTRAGPQRDSTYTVTFKDRDYGRRNSDVFSTHGLDTVLRFGGELVSFGAGGAVGLGVRKQFEARFTRARSNLSWQVLPARQQQWE
jgi:hypothetical protein